MRAKESTERPMKGRSVCTPDVLIEMGHGDPPLGLLHHVGLVAQTDVNDGRCQLAGLAVHLHGDGLKGGEGHFLTLVEAFAMTAHLEGGLQTNEQRFNWTKRAFTSVNVCL